MCVCVCVCVCVFNRCGLIKQGNAELGERMRPEWWAHCGIPRQWTSPPVSFSCVGWLAAASLFPRDIRPRCKPQQWASLSGYTIIFAHYCKWQERVVCRRSPLMSSRYALVIKRETNLNICRAELVCLQHQRACQRWSESCLVILEVWGDAVHKSLTWIVEEMSTLDLPVCASFNEAFGKTYIQKTWKVGFSAGTKHNRISLTRGAKMEASVSYSSCRLCIVQHSPLMTAVLPLRTTRTENKARKSSLTLGLLSEVECFF